MGYNLPINGVYWGYNPLTNHLLTSWDIQVPNLRNLHLIIRWLEKNDKHIPRILEVLDKMVIYYA